MIGLNFERLAKRVPERGDLIRSENASNYVNLVLKTEETTDGLLVSSVRVYHIVATRQGDLLRNEVSPVAGKRARRFIWEAGRYPRCDTSNSWWVTRLIITKEPELVDNVEYLKQRLAESDKLGNNVYYNAGETRSE